MNCSEGLSLRVVPPLSNRTLHHPSFLSLYMPACLPYCHQGGSQPVHPIIPAEVFYTDPTLGCRRRIPNLLTGMTVFGLSQLNTPQPIMSTCLAIPNRPDPFRFGEHPIRDLGSSMWRIHPQVQSRWAAIQLTQEEDQAVTTLLKLHHQEELQHHELITAARTDFPSVVSPRHFLTDPTFQDFSSAEEAHKPAGVDVQYLGELQQARGWSDSELEAASTLLSGFTQDEGDLLRTPDQHKMATTGTDALLCQITETQQDCETLSGSVICDSPKRHRLCHFSHVRDSGDIWPEDTSAGDFSSVLENNISPQRPSSLSLISNMKGRSKEQEVRALEEDAVHVLLSLRDIVT